MIKTVQQALFSTGLQLPKWEPVENKATDYEVRKYGATKWVSTKVIGMELDPAISKGFMRLFNYIQGNNEKKVKIEMTAPVTCLVEPGAGPICETTFTTSFYIPEEHQADPVKPSDPDVFIEQRPELTVFVRVFGGFTNAQKAQEELIKLSQSLQRDGQQFEENVYYTAGYDSPFKLFNRKNEVWLIKKTGEDVKTEA
ncbi:heme-binding protein 2 [Acipenser ruthenus]|uniref:heme-binding protein 2 n=1 Tax=Acipenser ruthenus TaxID=7906 RepID=UPI0027406734|nr:heme-binding protein 2 [Acipenser ruthenus]XP_033859062.2 heme-binding protein 2 [Acipenser ruthenus]XP_033859063.2 heme-binding protein 2 [Acipenser ruthenus]